MTNFGTLELERLPGRGSRNPEIELTNSIMKPLLTLLLLSASVGFSEEAAITRNTVMRAENSLVTLKAGTVVQVVARNGPTVAISVGGKTGTIPSSALEAPPVAAAPANATPAPARPAAVATPADRQPAPAPKATTMYGRAVEKARANAASHEKTLVKPTDDVLDGK
jgi:hypothetical protein